MSRRETARIFSGNGCIRLYIEKTSGSWWNPTSGCRTGERGNYDDFRRLRHPDFFRSVITYVIKWCDYVKNHAHIIRERIQTTQRADPRRQINADHKARLKAND
ncbi:hypothetical protein MZH44_26880 (plasmid) [Escherichia coli]|nr:hypothetical protein MZH44_26880 [Escherichia coli]